MYLKKCYICKITKPREANFYYWEAKNKYYSKCSVCTMKVKNAKFKTPEGKLLWRRATKNSYSKHKDRWSARSKLRNAVKKGEIEKSPCIICGEAKVQGHHYLGYDGEHWKDVQWLCQTHHRMADRVRKARKQKDCFGCKQLIEVGQAYQIEDYLPWHYPECLIKRGTQS